MQLKFLDSSRSKDFYFTSRILNFYLNHPCKIYLRRYISLVEGVYIILPQGYGKAFCWFNEISRCGRVCWPGRDEGGKRGERVWYRTPRSPSLSPGFPISIHPPFLPLSLSPCLLLQAKEGSWPMAEARRIHRYRAMIAPKHKPRGNRATSCCQ